MLSGQSLASEGLGESVGRQERGEMEFLKFLLFLFELQQTENSFIIEIVL